MAFCLEAEKFVDDKLSNWYVRRSRRRFWKSEAGADKLAAYQTLYTVLVTLAKLFAPVIPFLSETIYQNLRTDADPESVHLCDYPAADESLIDAALSADMEALLRLVTLGSAARNSVKIKVRQPLAELKVAGGESERRAVERFADQLQEELNIKRVALNHPDAGPLLAMHVRANLKSLGPRCGSHLQEIKRLIESGAPPVLQLIDGSASSVDLPLPEGTLTITMADVVLTPQAREEGWAGVADRGTQVALDTRITEGLAREGMAREVVRHVQDTRKSAGLEIEDRIELHLATDSEKLQQAIEAHRGYIAGETLALVWAERPLNGEAYQAKVTVDGQPLQIALRKVEK
jgi:isoleucyl-tRNA synthetase